MRFQLGLIGLAIAIPSVGAAAQDSEVRVFFGYENQRADLTPSTLSTLSGGEVSVERLVPPSGGSLLLDARAGFRSGSFPGFCEAAPPSCVPPTVHASNTQLLLLAGVRASAGVRKGRVFGDFLGGVGDQSMSTEGGFFVGSRGGWSPAVEGGAGAEAPIVPRVDARVRGSWLWTNFDDVDWHQWRHHLGLSVGIVVKP